MCWQESRRNVTNMIVKLEHYLRDWFTAIRFTGSSLTNVNRFDCNPVTPQLFQMPRLELTFHLPLHRYYSAFLSWARKLAIPIDLPNDDLFVKLLLMHP